LILFFLLTAIIKSFIGWKNNKPFGKGDNIIAIILLSFTHLQAIIGLGLYFMNGWSQQLGNMKDAEPRFWSMEHLLLMLFAVVLITVGRVKSKKATTDLLKHKKGLVFYSIALFIILWGGVIQPYLLGRGWF